MSASWIAGIDVGGTFTDLVAVNSASGEVRLAKVPTTPANQAFGVLAALDEAKLDFAEFLGTRDRVCDAGARADGGRAQHRRGRRLRCLDRRRRSAESGPAQRRRAAQQMEQYYPVLFEEYSLHEGSGGAGEYRGGFGDGAQA